MNISDLTGARLKAALDITRAIKHYHNKHKDGSGNFGFTIRTMDEATVKDVCFRLDGDYDSEGRVLKLTFGTYAGAGVKTPLEWEPFIQHVKKAIKYHLTPLAVEPF